MTSFRFPWDCAGSGALPLLFAALGMAFSLLALSAAFLLALRQGGGLDVDGLRGVLLDALRLASFKFFSAAIGLLVALGYVLESRRRQLS
ncbi:MAG: hypothetical protein H7831_17775, partial [Magnetococcus sp. WYHC-3]